MLNEINHVIEGKEKNLGDLPIRRILPVARQRMVGPFIFLDHMGPADLTAEHPMAVRAHPHIGLSTLTYLYEGQVHHRDSLGSDQVIIPGEVNWMTAGRGIAHSERLNPEPGTKVRMSGLQFWVALPKQSEDIEPSFVHLKKNQIPEITTASYSARLISGSHLGKTSPLKTYSPVTFIDVTVQKEGLFELPPTTKQVLGIYILKGQLQIAEQNFQDFSMITFKEGSGISLKVQPGTHFVVIGGEPFPEERLIWWNLVSSEQSKIDAAKILWKEDRFARVPGETERIPLPEH